MSSANCMFPWLIDGSYELDDDDDWHWRPIDRSRLSLLPPEMLQNVLGFYCNERTALRIAFTCRRMYVAITRNERLWRQLYEQRFHQPNDEDGVRIAFRQCDSIKCRMRLAHTQISASSNDTHGVALRDNGACGCRVDSQPPNGYTSWFAAYASRARLTRNWKMAQSSFWRTRPLTVSGVRLPKQLRILAANDHWALTASLAGVATRLYLICLPNFDSQKCADSQDGRPIDEDATTPGLPIAYPLDWLLPADEPADPVNQLGPADMAVLSDTHVAVRMPMAAERSTTPGAIVVWRLSDRRLTRRLVFQRRNGDILRLLNRWLIFRRFDDHLQKDIDFVCELTSENTCAIHRLEAIPGEEHQTATPPPQDEEEPHANATQDDGAGVHELHEFAGHDEVNSYGGCPPRMMYLPPDIGHFHCIGATVPDTLSNAQIRHSDLKYNAPLIYCCNSLERNQLRWSLVCLRSGQTITLTSDVCRVYEQEIYLKSSTRISDSRVLLTGARRDPISGCFSTWLAVHHWENNRLLFERGYPRSVRPDAAALIRSHSAGESLTSSSLPSTANSSALNLASEANSSYASLTGSVFAADPSSPSTAGTIHHRHSTSISGGRLVTNQCQDAGPDLLAWLQLGELMIIDLSDGSIRFHFHHDMSSLGMFRPVIGSLHMLIDDERRLLLDAATGWWQVYREDNPYAGYKLAGSSRLITLRQGRLSLVEFEAETRAQIDQRPSLRSVIGALRSVFDNA